MLEAAIEGRPRMPSARSGTEIEHAAEERIKPFADGKASAVSVEQKNLDVFLILSSVEGAHLSPCFVSLSPTW